MEINNSYDKTKFTSIMPIKFIQNGKVVTDENTIKAATSAVKKNARNVKSRLNYILRVYDRDFSGSETKVKRFKNYLFTGIDAAKLEIWGQDLAKAKARLAKYSVNADLMVDYKLLDLKDNLRRAQKNFSDFMKECFDKKSTSRIRIRQDKNGNYKGNFIDLYVNIGETEKKNHFKINNAAFMDHNGNTQLELFSPNN